MILLGFLQKTGVKFTVASKKIKKNIYKKLFYFSVGVKFTV